MHNQVSATSDNAEDNDSTTPAAGYANHEAAGAGPSDALSVLICDPCAARSFPETSVCPAGEVRFRYGDDGPVTAIEVAMELPALEVVLLPFQETFSSP
ncbi:unnamed protein product, partial [Laminaria digitata]